MYTEQKKLSFFFLEFAKNITLIRKFVNYLCVTGNYLNKEPRLYFLKHFTVDCVFSWDAFNSTLTITPPSQTRLTNTRSTKR